MKLTLTQQDIYFEQLMHPNAPIYNIGAKIAIKGEINRDMLNKAYVELINQHDAYRMVIDNSGEEVAICIKEDHDTQLGFVDFSTFQYADEEAQKYMQKTFKFPIKLNERGLLHKFILVKVRGTYHYLFSVYHHIITDGWGTSLMFQRLVKNYNELVKHGKIITLYPYTYKDFILDDQTYFLSSDFQKDKAYWVEKFKQLPEKLLGKIRYSDNLTQSKREETWIKRSTYNQLIRMGKDLRCSPFHLILGVLYLYFGRKYQNNDLVIGLPVLNRRKSDFKKTVGLFMGVSPLRMQFNFNDNFEDLVKKIRQQLRQDYRYQRFPLGKLIKELELFQEKDKLFNITLSYEKQDYADHFMHTETTVIPLSHQSERVALAIYIREFDEFEDVKIDFDYNLNYFNENSISQVVIHFQNLLANVIGNTQLPLYKYQYISENEKDQLLNHFNSTKFNYSKKKTLIKLFQEQVYRNPDQIALRDEMREYSYKELDIKSDIIAGYLRRINCCEQPHVIGVMMPRSADLVLVLLGVLKSGNAYVPLDPSFPRARLEYIIRHSGMLQIVGSEKLRDKIDFKEEYYEIETILRDANTQQFEIQISSEDTAYIVYTSGSTGDPKGVAISHQSLLNFLISIQHQAKIGIDDYLFSVTTPSFDISILEFFTPLISGATSYIAGQELLADPLSLIAKMDKLKPTVIQATPSFYQMLYDTGWKGSKKTTILCGGDLLNVTLAEKLLESNAEVWNMYGPTETTIWSSCKKLTQPKDASNVGKPINNTEFYILDEYMQLLPIGSIGKIYIGGDGLAQGYIKNRKLTDEKFIQNPFKQNCKIYDTGDLGRWNKTGEIEFLGRKDQQVKIRGYRIELGEIEARLNQVDIIKNSVVVTKNSESQESILVAYVIPLVQELDINYIIEKLQETLPLYMIPQIIVPIEEFPVTPNKKIDRKTLAWRKIITEEAVISREEPATNIEIALSRYYREVLGTTDEVSVTDNFFALGGHSLNAVKLINLINKELQFKTTLMDIFDYPTIKTLSAYLENKEKVLSEDVEPLEENSHYEITSSQYSIWLASQQEEGSIAYNMPAKFRILGEIDKSVLEQVFIGIIQKYEILRTNFLEIGGIPRQKIRTRKELQISIEEFFCEENKIENAIKSYASKVFDLEKEILIRIALFHQINGGIYLVFSTHHIIMDGWSLEILINEVVNSYQSMNEQKKIKKKALKFHFKDYVVWLQKQMKRTKVKNLNFWDRYLEGYSWKNIIPYDNEFSEEENVGATYPFTYDLVKTSDLNTLAQKHKISIHTLLLASFHLLLFKMYDYKDNCVGIVNSGRTLSTLQDQLGMFVKTLPMRINIKPKQSFSEMLSETHQNLMEINNHQDIPITIQNKLRLDVLFVLLNPSYDYTEINVDKNLTLQMYDLHAKYSRLPLLINTSINDECLSGSMDYNKYLYEPETIELINLRYEKLLVELIQNPDQTIDSVEVQLDFEKENNLDINFNF